MTTYRFRQIDTNGKRTDFYGDITGSGVVGETRNHGIIGSTNITIFRGLMSGSWWPSVNTSTVPDVRTVYTFEKTNITPVGAGRTRYFIPAWPAQSDFVGHGPTASLPTPYPSASIADRIFGITHAMDFRPAVEPMNDETEQRYTILVSGQDEVGPSCQFAQQIALSRSNAEIVICPCPKGGTTSTEWLPASGVASFFGAAANRTLNSLYMVYGTPQPVIPFWWFEQAPSNGSTSSLASQWAADMTTIANEIETIFADWLIVRPMRILFSRVQTDLPSGFNFLQTDWDALIANQESWQASNRVMCIKSNGNLNADNQHQNTTGQIIHGQRAAEAVLSASFI